MFDYNENLSTLPKKNADGRVDIDLDSHKFVKVWQGPNHPGITGNMSLELTICGDEIMEARTRVGYLHRGFEKLMERRLYMQSFPLVCRICVPEPDFNEYCFAAGVEDLSGIEITDTAKWLRTFNLELSRLQSYLMWIGGQAGAFGMGIIGQWGVYLRDLVLDLFEELSGARIYHMYTIPGGVRNQLPDGFRGRVLETLNEIERVIKHDMENALFNNAVFKKRTVGLAYIDPKDVDAFGITGPNARAAGVAKDVRKDYPYLKYDELDFETVVMTGSDVYTRTVLRKEDTLLSIDLIRQMLDKIPTTNDFKVKTPNPLHWKIPKGETYIRSECTRGEYGYYMVSDGSAYPRRVNVRGPSYTHAIALFEKMIVKQNISDVAGILVSLHTYPPEIER